MLLVLHFVNIDITVLFAWVESLNLGQVVFYQLRVLALVQFHGSICYQAVIVDIFEGMLPTLRYAGTITRPIGNQWLCVHSPALIISNSGIIFPFVTSFPVNIIGVTNSHACCYYIAV